MDELKVNVTTTGNEVVIRTGDALPPSPPKKISISGDINAVKSFLQKRTAEFKGLGPQFVNPETTIVIVDEEKMTVNLLLDPHDINGTEVLAQLLFSPDLEKFNINKNKKYTRAELTQLLKFSRRYFPNQEQYQKLLESYMKLNLTTTGSLKDEQDSRGNKDLQFKKEVSAQVPNSFIIELPIFKGKEPVRFMVDICLDVSEAQVHFWFESTELDDIINKQKKEIIQDAISMCEAFPVIYK